jgi:hypothetical protein
MQCRKRLQVGKEIRCKHKATVEGYCQEHWHLYQIGIEFHDPSQDFDYEDPELNDLIETLERDDFFNNHSIDHLIPKKEILKIDLGKFSKDKENVHTSGLVKKTIEIANDMMKLANENMKQDTLVCVLKSCKLSGKAQENMIEYYFMESSIYELPSPTFKLVLDGLWIYIQKQPSEIRKNLIERLQQELEDNSGTCAQGNLSRLVNTLNGFTHTIEEDVSLGDLMKKLMEEPNLNKRRNKAIDILKVRNVSKEDTKAWIELIESV